MREITCSGLAIFILMSGVAMQVRAEGAPPLHVRRETGQRKTAHLPPSFENALPRPLPEYLQPLSPAEIPDRRSDGRTLTGVHRALLAARSREGSWVWSRKVAVWRHAIHSPGAAGLRVHFRQFSVGKGRVWVHDGDTTAEAQGFYTSAGPWNDGDFWSDAVLSDTLVVEYQPEDGRAAEAPPFEIAEVSHMLQPDALSGNASAQNPVASCNVDRSCYEQYDNVSRAVGMIVYESQGATFVCSGTLLNTRSGSGIPYFLTANHCIPDDATARTAQTFFGYRSNACNGSAPALRSVPRVLGARYLTGAVMGQGDFSLLQLTSAPPDAVFAGWNPEDLPDGAPVIGIHHPAGDYMRISFGSKLASSAWDAFYGVRYTLGVVQGGSSGSGLFSEDGQLRGVLSTGPKEDAAENYCSLNTLVTSYGKFSVIYNAVRAYLEDRAPVSTPITAPIGDPDP